jgi:flagellar hook-associated protein 3 FlgL
MRISEASRYQNFLQDVGRAQERLQTAQRQVSSGMRVTKPSDDPAAAADIIRLSGEKTETAQYSKNLAFVKSKLQITEGIMETVQQLVERARTLGQTSLSNPAAADSYATEINAIRDQIISTSNSTFAGRYLFGGAVTTIAPFVKNPDSTVTYNGDSQTMPLEVGRSLSVETQIPGSDLFAGTVDIFQTLSDLTTAMQAADKAGIDLQVQNIEKFTDVLASARSKVGSYINMTSHVEIEISSSNIAREALLSKEQAADLAAAISELSTSQNALQATLAVGAKLSQLNIWDYLT